MARKDIQDRELWLKMARESEYSAGALAKRVGVSRRQLQRYTQELFKRSPQEWLNQQRLESAPALLKEHRSVKVVAGMLGFKQVSHFSREFKRQNGIGPMEFLAGCVHAPDVRIG